MLTKERKPTTEQLIEKKKLEEFHHCLEREQTERNRQLIQEAMTTTTEMFRKCEALGQLTQTYLLEKYLPDDDAIIEGYRQRLSVYEKQEEEKIAATWTPAQVEENDKGLDRLLEEIEQHTATAQRHRQETLVIYSELSTTLTKHFCKKPVDKLKYNQDSIRLNLLENFCLPEFAQRIHFPMDTMQWESQKEPVSDNTFVNYLNLLKIWSRNADMFITLLEYGGDK